MKGPKVDCESSLSKFHDQIFSQGKNQSLENLERDISLNLNQRDTSLNLNFSLIKDNKIATSPIIEFNDSSIVDLNKKMTTQYKCHTYVDEVNASTSKKSLFRELKKINMVKKALKKMRKHSTLNKKNQLNKLHYQIIGDISHIHDHKYNTEYGNKKSKYKVA